ncbi:MAG: serine/threonine protein kinase [Candidatus Eremiobacteraeota bacterium]|mgnify:CR=1 FL=1|nr:serine/threonine protein kinase [Candidatus Eremiobacteraeota bacterium]
MRRGQLLLGLLLAGTAWAQPPRDPVRLRLRVEPPGAYVYRETVSSAGNLELLGRAGDDLILDRTTFGDFVQLQIGGSREGKAIKAPNFHGYLTRSETLSTQVLKGDPVIYPGEQDSEPIRLRPAPGLGAWCERTLYWLQTHPVVVGVLTILLGSAGFFLVAVFLPRQKAWREENAKVAKFNARLRSLDIQNDVFLGRQFGEWATVKRLGAGGMAVVYKGVSTLTMNEAEAVAIKVMNPELAQDQDYRRRFSREVQISRTLDHPNVVRMIDYGEQDGILYLSMEYIQGETLRDMLPSKGLPLPDGIPIALGIVQGLIHAHQKGIVHRDLKPDNVMVTETKLVKVMDLGLAKREESDNVTRTGDTFGTPAYMAPEQITGGTLLPATDQYAFGVMMFELFTGRRPFEVADSLTLVMKHLQEPPPRVREYKSQLPDELESLIDRMLLKDPAKRYKSLVEVQVELTKIQRKYCGAP